MKEIRGVSAHGGMLFASEMPGCVEVVSFLDVCGDYIQREIFFEQGREIHASRLGLLVRLCSYALVPHMPPCFHESSRPSSLGSSRELKDTVSSKRAADNLAPGHSRGRSIGSASQASPRAATRIPSWRDNIFDERAKRGASWDEYRASTVEVSPGTKTPQRPVSCSIAPRNRVGSSSHNNSASSTSPAEMLSTPRSGQYMRRSLPSPAASDSQVMSSTRFCNADVMPSRTLHSPAAVALTPTSATSSTSEGEGVDAGAGPAESEVSSLLSARNRAKAKAEQMAKRSPRQMIPTAAVSSKASSSRSTYRPMLLMRPRPIGCPPRPISATRFTPGGARPGGFIPTLVVVSNESESGRSNRDSSANKSAGMGGEDGQKGTGSGTESGGGSVNAGEGKGDGLQEGKVEGERKTAACAGDGPSHPGRKQVVSGSKRDILATGSGSEIERDNGGTGGRGGSTTESGSTPSGTVGGGDGHKREAVEGVGRRWWGRVRIRTPTLYVFRRRRDDSPAEDSVVSEFTDIASATGPNTNAASASENVTSSQCQTCDKAAAICMCNVMVSPMNHSVASSGRAGALRTESGKLKM